MSYILPHAAKTSIEFSHNFHIILLFVEVYSISLHKLLLTAASNIADTAILGIPMYLPDSVVGVEVKSGHSIRYIELWLRKCKMKLDALAPQSAQKNINLEDLRPLKVLVPDYDEQKKISLIYENLDIKIMSEEAYLEKCKSVKQGLMQDLLTGKVPLAV